ncbi:MAG: CSLREA domain-containing protein [Deltaproteobacteria bacterium]|nr:CSLREA domain-containing protein [Deltaproteobacteria bacterium]
MVSSRYVSAIVAAFFAFSALPCSAATITVNTFEDSIESDGECSLREAVISANTDSAFGGCSAGSGDDEIVLAEGTYLLTRNCEFNDSQVEAESFGDDGAECDDLDVSDNLTVRGAGQSETIIEVSSEEIDEDFFGGSGAFRAFDVRRPLEIEGEGEQEECDEECDECVSLALEQLTITGGSAFNGGAVRVSSPYRCEAARLTASNVTFSDNRAFYRGGAISIKGQLSLVDSTFQNNSAVKQGGAVYLDWSSACDLSSSIVSSTFFDNTAYKGSGGALFLDTNTVLSIAGSTFTGNNASESGAAIAGTVTDLSITDSVISENGIPQEISESGLSAPFSPFFGGGISVGRFDLFSDGEEYAARESILLISDTEITGNQALLGGGGIATLGNFTTSITGERYSRVEHVYSTLRDSKVSENSVVANHIYVGSDAEPFFIFFSQSAGGGILNGSTGKMVIEQSSIDSNVAPVGGGISNAFQMELVRSSVTNNSSTVNIPTLPGSQGVTSQEGIDFFYTLGFSGGGGIFNAGSLSIDSTTISGNSTDGTGAGLLNVLSSYYAFLFSEQLGSAETPEGELIEISEPGSRLNNATVASNSIVPLQTDILIPLSVNDGIVGTYLNNGGGIATLRGDITVANSIIATNSDDQELLSTGDLYENSSITEGIAFNEADPDAVALFGNFAPDCYAFPSDGSVCDQQGDVCELFVPTIQSAQYNIIGTNQGCTPFQPAENDNNDTVGTEEQPVDPLLDSLTGDATLSHLPLKDSPALDGGSPDEIGELSASALASKPCAAKDQKGVNRPLAGKFGGTPRCDIGAIEAAVDCNSDPKGSAVLDVCGVCGGDGSSCAPLPTPTATPTIEELKCTEQNISETLFTMDGSSQALANLTRSIGGAFRRAGGSKKAAASAAEKTKSLHIVSWKATWSIPAIIKSDCTGTLSPTCIAASNAGFTSEYTASVAEINSVNQGLLKKLKRLKVKKSAIKKLTKKNDAAYAAALGAVGTVPGTSATCSF